MRIWLSSAAVACACALACGDDVTVEEIAPMAGYAAARAGPGLAPELRRAEKRKIAEPAIVADKLIRTAELSVEVRAVQKAIASADSIAKALGGIVADSRVSGAGENRRSAELRVRVPSARLDDAIAALQTLGEVNSSNITTQDITREYADLETRLSVKEQTVTRLRALLGDRTGKLSDILEVEREIGRAVEELERMKGERRFYDDRVGMSDIALRMWEHASLTRPRLFRRVADAFQSSIASISDAAVALVYLVTFLVPWVAIALGIWWIRKRVTRRAM